MTVHLTLIAKPGCHLCDDARAAIETVRDDLQSRDVSTSLEELDILADPELARLHAEDIPVVLVEGRRHSIWHVDPARLTDAVLAAARSKTTRAHEREGGA